MEFPAVPNLSLGDEFFEYQGCRYKYTDVVSIEFGAAITKHSVNFVPAGKSYDAKLTIFPEKGQSFEIKPSKGWFGGLKEAAFTELQRVNAALSFMTFNARVERYEAEIQKDGMFRMGGFEFHRNGNLSQGGKYITNLRDGSHSLLLGAFTVTISKKRKSLTEKLKSSWSGESTIYIGKNRDCFIYLMSAIYRMTWKNEYVPEKRVDNKRVYYDAVVRLGAWLSAIDGSAESSELAQLKRFFNIDAKTFPDAAKIFNEQLKSPRPPKLILQKFNSVFADAEEIRESLLVGLLTVALADGIFHSAEKHAMEVLGSLLGFQKNTLIRLYAAVGLDYEDVLGKGQDGARSRAKAAEETNHDALRLRHLEILGLTLDATEAEIKSGYRRLVKKYHPDILRSQGLPENEMRHAQRVLGQVIESYEWLTKTL